MSKRIICFGETLWDVLPSGAVPGGAPMNVAIRSKSLGLNASIISKVGKDDLGKQLREFLLDNEVDISLLQEDNAFPTGEVHVAIDKNGIASYTIAYPAAWDKIELWDEAIEKVSKCDAFVFGSLACRDLQSRKTLMSLLEHAKFKIFDVNLRPGFFDLAFIDQVIRTSDLIKLNDEELLILAKKFGYVSDDEFENIKFIKERFGVKSICVTRGANGAILYINNTFYSNKGIKVKVADTVGSGDSFLSALIYRLLHVYDLQQSLNYACAVGSFVATKTGANPKISEDEIKELLNQF